MCPSFLQGTSAPGVYANINTGFIGMPAPPESSDAFFVVNRMEGKIRAARNRLSAALT